MRGKKILNNKRIFAHNRPRTATNENEAATKNNEAKRKRSGSKRKRSGSERKRNRRGQDGPETAAAVILLGADPPAGRGKARRAGGKPGTEAAGSAARIAGAARLLLEAHRRGQGGPLMAWALLGG